MKILHNRDFTVFWEKKQQGKSLCMPNWVAVFFSWRCFSLLQVRSMIVKAREIQRENGVCSPTPKGGSVLTWLRSLGREHSRHCCPLSSDSSCIQTSFSSECFRLSGPGGKKDKEIPMVTFWRKNTTGCKFQRERPGRWNQFLGRSSSCYCVRIQGDLKLTRRPEWVSSERCPLARWGK